ncbi:MAG TPA: host attachment family protein [Stenotrophomonas sp.]|jgi:protein required for attachment to host cells
MGQRIPEGTVVVVADGGSARVFTNVGSEREPQLHQQANFAVQNIDDEGPAGGMPKEMSEAQLDEATFAKQLAAGLNEGALNNRYQHLVLVADPATLGRIRPLLHKETQARLLGDLAKDFTNAPLDDIQRALR